MAKTGEAKVKLSLINNVSPQLKKINNEVKSLSNNMNKSLAQATRNANNFTSALSKATRGFSTTNQQVNKISQSLARMNTQMNNMGKGNNSLEAQLKRANTQAQSLERTMKRISNLRTGGGGNGFNQNVTNRTNNNSSIGMRNALLEAALSATMVKKLIPKNANAKALKGSMKGALSEARKAFKKSMSDATQPDWSSYGNILKTIERNRTISKSHAFDTFMQYAKESSLDRETAQARKRMYGAYKDYATEKNATGRHAFFSGLGAGAKSFGGSLVKAVGGKAAIAAGAGTLATGAVTAAFAGLTASVVAATAAMKGIASLGVSLSDSKTSAVNKFNLVGNGEELYAESLSRATKVRANATDYAETVAGLMTRGGVKDSSTAMAVADVMYSAGAMSGATTQQTQAATTQLLQSLASGTLQGDELKSIMENAPALADVIATGLGVDVGQLKAMGANGELSSGKVLEALMKGQSSMAGGSIVDFLQNSDWTFGQILDVTKNIATEYLQPMADDFRKIAGFLAGFVINNTESTGQALQTGWSNYKNGFLSQVGDPTALLTSFQSSFNRLMSGSLPTALGQTGGALANAGATLFSDFANLDFGGLGNGATAFINGLKDLAHAIASSGVTQALLNTVGTLMEKIGQIGTAAAPAIEVLGKILSIVLNAATAVAGGILDTIIKMINVISGQSGTVRTVDEEGNEITYTIGSTETATTAPVQTSTEGYTSTDVTMASMQPQLQYVTENAGAIKEALGSLPSAITPAEEAMTKFNETIEGTGTKMEEVANSATSWGEHFCSNLAAGLESGLALITAKMDLIVAQLARAEHSVPKEPALRKEREWGKHYGQNIAYGLQRGLEDVKGTMNGYINVLAMRDENGKLSDNSLSTLQSFNTNNQNKSINVNLNVSNSFKGGASQTDIQNIVKSIESGLRQSLSTSLV